MSVITKRGQEAKQSIKIKNKSIDFKKVFIRLKDGDSVRVRILSPEDYVEYISHGSYLNGIYTQPCITVTGQRCLHCEASKVGEEKFKDLFGKKRYIFAFYDVDDRSLRAFDASKSQATGLMDTIEEYTDCLEEVAFTLKRTGNGLDTKYKLTPIMPKSMKQIQRQFDEANGMVVEDEFFDCLLQPRTIEQQYEELQKAGFPVEQLKAGK